MASKSVIGRESAALVLEQSNVLILYCIRKRYSLFITFKVCIFYSSHSCCWLRELEEVSEEYDSHLAPDNDYTSCLFISFLSLHVQIVNLSSYSTTQHEQPPYVSPSQAYSKNLPIPIQYFPFLHVQHLHRPLECSPIDLHNTGIPMLLTSLYCCW